MENNPLRPRLVKRKNGHWLALSADADSLKVGVSAPSAEEARSKFADTIMQWNRILALSSEQSLC